MYQLKTVESRKITNGYEIQVLGNLCRIESPEHVTEFAGTYAACVKWLKDRGMLAIPTEFDDE